MIDMSEIINKYKKLFYDKIVPNKDEDGFVSMDIYVELLEDFIRDIGYGKLVDLFEYLLLEENISMMFPERY